MTADTPDIAKLAAEMRARAEAAQKDRQRVMNDVSDKAWASPIIQDAFYHAACPDNVLAILDALARADARADKAEQERDAARETIGRLCEALEPFGRNPYGIYLRTCFAHLTREDAYRASRALARVREGGADV